MSVLVFGGVLFTGLQETNNLSRGYSKLQGCKYTWSLNNENPLECPWAEQTKNYLQNIEYGEKVYMFMGFQEKEVDVLAMLGFFPYII